MTEFRSGTSSWSEKGWVGPFYPRGTKPADMLAYYATQFDTVECDSTYYGSGSKRNAAAWRAKTPDGFVMAAKFPQPVVTGTDDRQVDAANLFIGDNARCVTDGFLDAMRELGPRCGPLVVQTPKYAKRDIPTLREFLDKLEPFLDALPRTFRYALEVRRPDWLTEELTSALRKRDVAIVLAEFTGMPHPDEWECELVTTDFTYCRLIGDRYRTEALTETFDKIVIPKAEHTQLLERWKRLLASRSSIREPAAMLRDG